MSDSVAFYTEQLRKPQTDKGTKYYLEKLHKEQTRLLNAEQFNPYFAKDNEVYYQYKAYLYVYEFEKPKRLIARFDNDKDADTYAYLMNRIDKGLISSTNITYRILYGKNKLKITFI